MYVFIVLSVRYISTAVMIEYNVYTLCTAVIIYGFVVFTDMASLPPEHSPPTEPCLYEAMYARPRTLLTKAWYVKR